MLIFYMIALLPETKFYLFIKFKKQIKEIFTDK